MILAAHGTGAAVQARWRSAEELGFEGTRMESLQTADEGVSNGSLAERRVVETSGSGFAYTVTTFPSARPLGHPVRAMVTAERLDFGRRV